MFGNSSKLNYFLGGLAIGAVVSILFAPRSGEENLDYFNQRLEDGKEYARRKARKVRERGTQIVAEQREVIADVVEAGREVVERGKQIVADQKEVISKAVAAGREAYQREKPKESL